MNRESLSEGRYGDLIPKRSDFRMTSKPAGFFEGTEMPTAGWWEALWLDPAGVLTAVGVKPGMEVIDLC